MGAGEKAPGLTRVRSPDFDVLVQQTLETSLLSFKQGHEDELDHAENASSRTNALASLSQSGTKSLVASVFRALEQSPSRISLTITQIARQAPPSHLRPHWSNLTQRVITVLKAAKSPEDRTAPFLALAALLAAAKPYQALGGSSVAAIATVAESAIVHALRVVQQGLSVSIEDGVVCTPEITRLHISALAALHAAVYVAPNQVRLHLAALESALWMNSICYPQHDVRRHASTLLAALPACYPLKSRGTVLTSLLDRAVDELVSIRQSFSKFEFIGLSSEPMARHAHESPASLVNLYESLCGLIRAFLRFYNPTPVEFPLQKLIEALLSVLRYVTVDPFATACGNIDVSAFSSMLPYFRMESLRLCTFIVTSISRSSLLPYARLISRGIASCLISPRRGTDSIGGASTFLVGIAERLEAYKAASQCMTVLGSPAIEALASSLVSSLETDLPNAVNRVDRDLSPFALKDDCGQKLLGLPNHQTRPNKRRRQNGTFTRCDDQAMRQMARNDFASPEYDPVELQRESPHNTKVVAVKAAVYGLEACVGMISSRSFCSSNSVDAILRLEKLLMSCLFARDELGCAIIRVFSSIILSGGSGRPFGRSSPILRPTMVKLRTLIRNSTTNGSFVTECRIALASCETLIHPSGPPIRPIMPDMDNPATSEDASALGRGHSRPLFSTPEFEAEKNCYVDDEDINDSMKQIYIRMSLDGAAHDAEVGSGASAVTTEPTHLPDEADASREIDTDEATEDCATNKSNIASSQDGVTSLTPVACSSSVEVGNISLSVAAIPENADLREMSPVDAKLELRSESVDLTKRESTASEAETDLMYDLKEASGAASASPFKMLKESATMVAFAGVGQPTKNADAVNEKSLRGDDTSKEISPSSDDDAEDEDIINSIVFDGGPDAEDT